MKRLLPAAFCCLAAITCFSQNQFTVSGYVKDAANGEALIGTSIFVTEVSTGTTSNVYGFYSITLPKGTYHLSIDYVGYNDQVKEVELNRDVRLDLELLFSEQMLQTVEVTDKALDENVQSIEMSTATLDVRALEKLPAFAGEVDLIKSIQLLPGVSTVGEGASGFNVRGGSVGQNLVLLDEAPVYQSSHLFGFFSVFNPDAVKDVKLYKGGIPAQYGGRISSLLDIRMKEGNNKEYDVKGGLGTIFSRLSVEGPIKKNKSSFILAARRSYADVVAKAVTDAMPDDSKLYFYDITAKTNFNINERNRIFVSGYFGRDVFKFDKFQGFNWGNRTATFRWNHLYGNKLFSNLTLFHSNYDYGFQIGENELDKYDWKSEIKTYNFKPEFTWFPNTSHEISFGGEAIVYDFRPANAVSVSEGVTTDISLDHRKAVEASLFISDNHKVTDKLSLQYGFRFGSFRYLGGSVFHYGDTVPGIKRPLRGISEKGDWEEIASFQNPEPRFSFRYQVSKTSSVKGSYNRMVQYIHLISNTTAATPIDIWQPSSNNIQPQLADQVALGYFRNLKNNQYETSAEVYYKTSKNQVDYIDGADLFINQFLESQLLNGIGRAYGLELYVKKNSGRLTGWISYTLGKSEFKVDGINYGTDHLKREGNWYAARFDQRHNFKVASFYDLKKNVTLSANFSYISGTPTTFPTDRIVVQGYVIPYISGSARNNYRIPDYHRLDVAVTFDNIWRGRKGRKGEDNLVVSIYNVYARQNPFSIYFSQGTDRQPDDAPATTSAKQLSMIGTLVPAITYNFKF
jgi:hypothetical protein